MQSGFRGFLLTGQNVFLQPYYEGLETVPALTREQRLLVISATQKERLDSINFLHQQWVHYANALITTRLDTFPEASRKYKELFETKLRMEVGKRLNDRIQKIFLDFDNNEYSLRQSRRETLAESIRLTRDISIFLTITSIVIGLISSLYFIRNITNRIKGMVDLAEKISKGDFRTIEDKRKDELNKLSVSLNIMSQTLKSSFEDLTFKNYELDQFSYVVSHDLKAPLRGISNIISWIEEDHAQDITPEIGKNLALIKGRTIRLENMINGLLDYAKIGRTRTVKQEVRLSILVPEIIELVVPKTFNVKINGELPNLVAEKYPLEQVFSNLLSNAVKYSRDGRGEISISVKSVGNFYSFSVKDTGIGIQKEYFDKIFIIFQTLQERDAFESTGVGLAIVKKIVEDHKGTIQVESEIGQGSTFTFTWPKN